MKTLTMIPKFLLICSFLLLASCIDDKEKTDDALNLSDSKLELSISPKNSDVSVATNLNTILLTFSSSVELISEQIIQSNPPINYHLDTSKLKDNNVLYIILDEKLQASTTYTFLLKDIKNLDTEKLESFAWDYTTLTQADTRAPELVSTLPLDSAVNVSDTLDKIEITFNENIKLSTFKDLVISPAVAGIISISGKKLIFKPQAALNTNVNYRLTINNVSDLSGNILGSEVAINFLTGEGATSLSTPTLTVTSSPNSPTPSFSWNPATSASGIVYYKIKKSLTRERIPTFDTLSNSTLSYTDSGLEKNQTYYYQLKISDKAGNIVRSNVVVVTTFDSTTKDSTLPVAGALSTDGEPLENAISVKWKTGSDNIGITRYQLKRTVNHGATELVTTLNAAPNTSTYRYTDKNVIGGQHYTYQLHAIDAAGNQGLSNLLTANTPNAGTVTPPPSSTAPVTKKALTLSWSSPTRNSDNSCIVNLQGYNISFKSSSSQYTLLKSLAVDSTQLNCTIDTKNTDAVCGNATICSFQTKELAANTWFFKVQAINNQGSTSPDSNELSSLIN